MYPLLGLALWVRFKSDLQNESLALRSAGLPSTNKKKVLWYIIYHIALSGHNIGNDSGLGIVVKRWLSSEATRMLWPGCYKLSKEESALNPKPRGNLLEQSPSVSEVSRAHLGKQQFNADWWA